MYILILHDLYKKFLNKIAMSREFIKIEVYILLKYFDS